MPPKKGSSKKPEKPRTPILIDGLTKDEISKEQLEEHIMRLREELDQEREERNYFQLERDKVQSFWDITQRKLQEATAELQNLDKDLEETEIKLQVEKKVYRQKMRHLLCEHQNTVCELDAEKKTLKEAMQEEQKHLEDSLKSQEASLLIDLHQVDTETPVLQLKTKHQEEMANLSATLEQKLQDVEDKYEERGRVLQQDLQNRRVKEVREIRANYDKSISVLLEKNTAAANDAKDLLKDTAKGSEVNTELKEDVADEASILRQKEKALSQVLKENQQLTENLSRMQQDIDQLQKKMRYKPKKFDNKKEVDLNNLAQEHEMLQQRFKELQMEKAELHVTHAEALDQMQNKAAAKHMQMEQKVQHLTDRVQEMLLIPKH